jgi:predicted transposase YdaD
MDDETRNAKLAELRERIRLARDTRTSEAQTDVLMVQKMATVSNNKILQML